MRKKNPKTRTTISQLRGVSPQETNRLASLDSIFSGSYTPDDDVIKTLNMISSLIGDNIRTSKDLANFDTHIFKEEASTLLNIRMKYEATLLKDVKELKLANKIYNKHKRLSVLMN
jgi:hypothetical protein|tara:strand:+ start:158 stop:505 length:348 start_codon:yes stop_codon:yes gene_type:complete